MLYRVSGRLKVSLCWRAVIRLLMEAWLNQERYALRFPDAWPA
jgi:hypothetical protein